LCNDEGVFQGWPLAATRKAVKLALELDKESDAYAELAGDILTAMGLVPDEVFSDEFCDTDEEAEDRERHVIDEIKAMRLNTIKTWWRRVQYMVSDMLGVWSPQ
jgi:hypothetical protein